MGISRMSPVLKWAGGKTQILGILEAGMPHKYNRYFEPFVGSAAVLLHFTPARAVINDINSQLINLYKQLKTNVAEVIQVVNRFDAIPCDKEVYNSLRKTYNDKLVADCMDAECAGLMIWLNKHCFNGLYRVNSKGLFNVSYNNSTRQKSIDEDNLMAISDYLRGNDIEIICGDFEVACENVRGGDFVYLDSPFVPVSATSSFTSYTANGFTYEDHVRLSHLFRLLDGRGALLMLSNNDVPLVRELYDGYNIKAFDVKRMINSKADKRTGKEVLITNY